MSQKGFAPVLIVILVLGLILFVFVPFPYYEPGGRFCIGAPFGGGCTEKGWYFGPSLWNRLSSQFLNTQGPGGSKIPTPPPNTCTQDAKVCPDGTSVGRVGPTCEFALCLISPQEVDEAKRLALADPKVKEKLRAAGVAENELIITHLFTRTLPGEEMCRCVYLFFNTKGAVLPIEPIVDLTTKEVHLK